MKVEVKTQMKDTRQENESQGREKGVGCSVEE